MVDYYILLVEWAGTHIPIQLGIDSHPMYAGVPCKYGPQRMFGYGSTLDDMRVVQELCRESGYAAYFLDYPELAGSL